MIPECIPPARFFKRVVGDMGVISFLFAAHDMPALLQGCGIADAEELPDDVARYFCEEVNDVTFNASGPEDPDSGQVSWSAVIKRDADGTGVVHPMTQAMRW